MADLKNFSQGQKSKPKERKQKSSWGRVGQQATPQQLRGLGERHKHTS